MRKTPSPPESKRVSTASRDDESTASASQGSGRGEGVGVLHRAVGNQAVQSATRDGAGRLAGTRDCEACDEDVRDDPVTVQRRVAGTVTPRAANRDGSGGTPVLVRESNEEYEREAERVARSVVNGERGDTGDGGGRVKSLSADRVTDDAGSGLVDAVRGRGRRLRESTRSFFESRMGYDFGHVRVHTGPRADEAARSLDAKAFTVGRHVGFRSGTYRPDTRTGKRLLAHELTHVVQQAGSGLSGVRRVMAYRDSSRPAFGAADSIPPDLGGEKEWKPSKRDEWPWVRKITVDFEFYSSWSSFPKGKLTAEYANNGAVPNNATNGLKVLGIAGGHAGFGYSNQGEFTVDRIEGWGYHDNPAEVTASNRLVQNPNWREAHYYDAAHRSNASMSFALYFTGSQAIHYGPGNAGSKACVHVPDREAMKQINYHTVKDETVVDINYNLSDDDMAEMCCDRLEKDDGIYSLNFNPCTNVSESKCGGGSGS